MGRRRCGASTPTARVTLAHATRLPRRGTRPRRARAADRRGVDRAGARGARGRDARRRGHPGGRRGHSRPDEEPATRGGPASSATATGSCTRARSGGSRARPRCSSSPRTTSAPASPTPSRSPRSRAASPGPSGSTSRSPRRSRSATTAGTAPAATRARTRSTPSSTAGSTTRRGARTVSLATLNLCVETLDGIANHSWSRPAPATPEGEVVSWADRIGYVCHDFEDAVSDGIVRPDELPASRRGAVRHRPRRAARRVHRRRWSPRSSSTGVVGMDADARRGARCVPRVQLRAHLPARRVGRPGRGRRRGPPRARRALRRASRRGPRRDPGRRVDATPTRSSPRSATSRA